METRERAPSPRRLSRRRTDDGLGSSLLHASDEEQTVMPNKVQHETTGPTARKKGKRRASTPDDTRPRQTSRLQREHHKSPAGSIVSWNHDVAASDSDSGSDVVSVRPRNDAEEDVTQGTSFSTPESSYGARASSVPDEGKEDERKAFCSASCSNLDSNARSGGSSLSSRDDRETRDERTTAEEFAMDLTSSHPREFLMNVIIHTGLRLGFGIAFLPVRRRSL